MAAALPHPNPTDPDPGFGFGFGFGSVRMMAAFAGSRKLSRAA
ncbi:hypothetical protein ACIBI9_30725 [Nonomuraea sp. NPDC050451]